MLKTLDVSKSAVVFKAANWSPVVAVLLVLLLAVVAPGCGEAVARPADPASARSALTESLDAWTRGESCKDRVVRVADEDWLAGQTLVSYRVQGEGQSIGSHLRCPVQLSVRNARGKVVAKQVVYDVATDPTPIVVRLDTP